MFDTTGLFTRWFKPVSGGYVYYPKSGAGGKLVTQDEYEDLVAGWERAAGPRAMWLGAGLVFLTLLFWMLLSKPFALPKWTNWVILIASASGILVRIFCAAFAPVRLVKNRADHVPPQPASEFRREARATIKWPVVLCILAISATAFLGHLVNGKRSPTDWAWLVGSGYLFVSYMRIALLKLRER